MPNIVDIYRQKKATEESKEYERKLNVLRSENWVVQTLLENRPDIKTWPAHLQEDLQRRIDQIP